MRTSRHDLASTLTSTIPAPGSNSGSFEIINYESGKCLGTSAGHDDADAVQWTCNGAPNQQWHWGGSFEGFTQLINGNDGGNSQCLGIAGGATNQGADAVGWTCNGLQNQFWLPSVTGGDRLPGFRGVSEPRQPVLPGRGRQQHEQWRERRPMAQPGHVQ
jgi:hypothetical protein